MASWAQVLLAAATSASYGAPFHSAASIAVSSWCDSRPQQQQTTRSSCLPPYSKQPHKKLLLLPALLPHQYLVPIHMEASSEDSLTHLFSYWHQGASPNSPIPATLHSDVAIHSASPCPCLFLCAVTIISDVTPHILYGLTSAHPDSWHTPTQT